MGRSRGGGGRRSRRPAPAPATKSRNGDPPMVPQGRSGGGFFSTMAQGFALGTGSAVAHEAIHGMTRGFSGGSGGEQQDAQPQHQQQAPEACGYQQKAFLDCMDANRGEMSMCQYYFDAMQKCKLSNPTLQ
mmetsp:Transcript_1546/g.3401  ORF Transcript_1546/g.3401 Transcript_1546/m.3401 type:complete len:131 (+) Transcript_1546:77-469(+)